MKKMILLFAAIIAAFAFTTPITPSYEVGDVIEDFEMKNVDGEMVSLSDYNDEKGVIMIFTSNTCPTAQAYEKRIIKLHKRFVDQGYPVMAIGSNDPVIKPGDTYEAMVERAIDMDYKFAYLRDEDQSVAMRFGAMKTPHVYLLQKHDAGFKLVYVGAIDNNTEENLVTENYVENAIASLEKGEQPNPSKTIAIGCGIKWRQN